MVSRLPGNLLDTLQPKGGYEKAHHKRRREWVKFLKEAVPDSPNSFAIIELLNDSWGIHSVIRDACSRCGIVSQMIKSIQLKHKDGEPEFRSRTDDPYRATSAVREVVYRHHGGLYGEPVEIYRAAKFPLAEIAELDVLAFYLENNQQGVLYPVAVRLNFYGSVDTSFPDSPTWQPYHHGATALGRFMSDQWVYRKWRNDLRKPVITEASPLNLSNQRSALRNFVRDVLSRLQRPTLMLMERKDWGQKNIFWEVTNPELYRAQTFLNLKRSDATLENVIGVIRLQAGINTPQYLIRGERPNLDLTFRMEFVDTSNPDLPYYYSIGERLSSTKHSHTGDEAFATMHDDMGAGISYRHPQVVELAPFFVREDFDTIEGKTMLCRTAHYLRVLPAWEHGSPVYPYPMHLAQVMMEDQLAVLALD